jgi:hypothetical protein
VVMPVVCDVCGVPIRYTTPSNLGQSTADTLLCLKCVSSARTRAEAVGVAGRLPEDDDEDDNDPTPLAADLGGES